MFLQTLPQSPKQRQTPYMKITLSHRALPDLVEKGAT